MASSYIVRPPVTECTGLVQRSVTITRIKLVSQLNVPLKHLNSKTVQNDMCLNFNLNFLKAFISFKIIIYFVTSSVGQSVYPSGITTTQLSPQPRHHWVSQIVGRLVSSCVRPSVHAGNYHTTIFSTAPLSVSQSDSQSASQSFFRHIFILF